MNHVIPDRSRISTDQGKPFTHHLILMNHVIPDRSMGRKAVPHLVELDPVWPVFTGNKFLKPSWLSCKYSVSTIRKNVWLTVDIIYCPVNCEGLRLKTKYSLFLVTGPKQLGYIGFLFVFGQYLLCRLLNCAVCVYVCCQGVKKFWVRSKK